MRARGHLPDSVQAPHRGPRSRASLVEWKTAFGMTHAEAMGIVVSGEHLPPGPGRTPRKVDRPAGSLVAAAHRREAGTVFLRLLTHTGRHPASARRAATALSSSSRCPSKSKGCVHDRRLAASADLTTRACDAPAASSLAATGRRAVAFGSWTSLHTSCSRRSRAVEAFVPTNVGTRGPLTPPFPAPRTGIGRSSGSGPRLSRRS